MLLPLMHAVVPDYCTEGEGGSTSHNNIICCVLNIITGASF